MNGDVVVPEVVTPRVQVRLILVPVEVFGADGCDHPGCDDPQCPGGGYGVMDAVGPGFSDCNRAIGHIYRVEDLSRDGEEYLVDDGQQVRVAVWVDQSDLPFFKVNFDSET